MSHGDQDLRTTDEPVFLLIALIPLLLCVAVTISLGRRSRKPPHQGEPRTLIPIALMVAFGALIGPDLAERFVWAVVCGLVTTAAAYVGWARRGTDEPARANAQPRPS